MIVYFNGTYLSLDEVKISPYDRGFQFSDGVYEVIRLYNHNFFRFEDHIERLKYSIDQLKINFTSFNQIKNILFELIEINNFKRTQILSYIQITRGAYYPRIHYFPPAEVNPTVFISVSPFYPGFEELEKGVKVILEKDMRWFRRDIKSISLLPCILAKQKAVEMNAKEAILVRDGFITEGTHTTFCGINKSEMFTHPLNNFILPGVTRKVILEICYELKIKINEIPIAEKNIFTFDEFFILGTSSEVTPVIQIDNTIIGNGKRGETTKKIQEKYREIVINN